MIKININETVYKTLQTHPEFKTVLFEAGFTKIMQKQMLETVAKFTTIKMGMRLRKIPHQLLESIANDHGYTLIDIKKSDDLN